MLRARYLLRLSTCLTRRQPTAFACLERSHITVSSLRLRSFCSESSKPPPVAEDNPESVETDKEVGSVTEVDISPDAVEAQSQADGSGVSGEHGDSCESGALPPAASPPGGIRKRHGDIPKLPTVLAIPLPRRPLLPGQQAAVNIAHPAVADAVMRIYASGTPFVATFLSKHSASEKSQSIFEEAEEEAFDLSNDEPVRSSKSGARVASLSKKAIKEFVEDPVNDLHKVGCFARIEQVVNGGGRGLFAVLSGQRRVEILKATAEPGTMPCYVDVAHWDEQMSSTEPVEDVPDNLMTKALVNEAIALVRQIAAINPLFKEHIDIIRSAMERVDLNDPGRIADFATTITTATPVELQEVLDTREIKDRLEKSLLLLRKELEASQLQVKIGREVEDKMSKQHREFLLREQLKVIKKELGMERDEKETLVDKFVKKLSAFPDINPEVKKVIDEEIEKLQTIEKQSSEFNVTRTYLDWLTSVPWGVTSAENLNIKHATKVLDEDHYGLQDVKERILEFIAVGKLRGKPSSEGRILCFIGPPGVGKTSIGKSIARAVNREFYRFSVGGLFDVAEIKGHRRTYVGAMPGKLVQCLKQTQVSNPLILIDEIDKLGHGGNHGDPASALLEVLDPSQNKAFNDHYLDVPVDLSKVLFVCTANTLDTIPGPLLDRMEVIRLSGYDLPEKMAIAKNYLVSKALQSTGLTSTEVSITDSALEGLIRGYCREAGVRNLEKHIEKILRKIGLKVAKAQEESEIGNGVACARISEAKEITSESLQELVGKAPFPSELLYDKSVPPGVVMGLAWTSMGGSALYVEAVTIPQISPIENDSTKATPQTGRVEVTGQLGSVMTESMKISVAVARRALFRLDSKNPFFSKEQIHIHFPEGATPKDGPSAGVTMATALLSLAQNVPVSNEIAMTGELSLTGLVLPVGGIKEKVIAAKRAAVKRIFLPEGNRRDAAELPKYLLEDVNITFIAHFDQLYEAVFKSQETSEKMCSPI